MTTEAAPKKDQVNEEEKDLDTVFSEMAEQREGTGTAKTAPAEQDNLKEGGKDAGQADAASADAGGKDDAPGDKDKPTGGEDPYKGWPEDAITKVKAQQEEMGKLEHRLDSDAGRVRAFQRKYEDLTSEVELLKSGKGSQTAVDELTAALENDEDWKELKEEHPELAAGLDKRIVAALKIHSEQVDKTLAPVIENQHNTNKQEALGVLTSEYPTWIKEVQTEEFKDWKNGRSAVVRSLGASDNAEDALELMSLYDTHRIANGLPSLKPDLENKSDVNSNTDAHDKLRQDQLEDGAGIESKPAGVEAGENQGDYDTEWNRQANKREGKRQQA